MCVYPEISGGFNNHIETFFTKKAISAIATN